MFPTKPLHMKTPGFLHPNQETLDLNYPSLDYKSKVYMWPRHLQKKGTIWLSDHSDLWFKRTQVRQFSSLWWSALIYYCLSSSSSLHNSTKWSIKVGWVSNRLTFNAWGRGWICLGWSLRLGLFIFCVHMHTYVCIFFDHMFMINDTTFHAFQAEKLLPSPENACGPHQMAMEEVKELKEGIVTLLPKWLGEHSHT